MTPPIKYKSFHYYYVKGLESELRVADHLQKCVDSNTAMEGSEDITAAMEDRETTLNYYLLAMEELER